MPKRNSKIKANEEKELLVFKNDILKLMLLDDMEINTHAQEKVITCIKG